MARKSDFSEAAWQRITELDCPIIDSHSLPPPAVILEKYEYFGVSNLDILRLLPT